MNRLIYGKDPVQRIVASEVRGEEIVNYIADGNKTRVEKRPFYYYVLLEEPDTRRDCGRLGGKNDFQYFVKFKDKQDMYNYCRELQYENKEFWRCYNPVESAMLREGYTYYKGMTMNEVSALSFDIETTGVTIDDNSFVTLISNTYRDRSGNITRKLFSFDDYDSPKDFLLAWCKWVRQMDPDIMLGHNILAFDIPYLMQVARIYRAKLCLGRNSANLRTDRNPRKFRKDGSQAYDYHNAHIFGREIVDTFFLSMKYDIARNYPSYGLKPIMKYEGLEKEDRQHWDFSKNKEPWNNPADWSKFKQYAMDDADDALALWDLMAPQYFYYAQSIPKPFQEIINTATGSQVNAFMVRGYLQESQAIPMASAKQPFEGGLVIGNPGVYQNAYKVDVASLYPSIMLQYEITDDRKDPEGRFLKAVRFFTEQRLEDKRLAAETGERIYKDLSNGRKIMINSFYGFMGAPGLNFNYPKGATAVTEKGREILQGAINWAEKNSHVLVNADTDSITFVPNPATFRTIEGKNSLTMNECLDQINELSPDGIVWEDDGEYESIIVVKAKNYALKADGKVKIKGSGLKATMKETALRDFLNQAIQDLLNNDVDAVRSSYMDHVRRIGKIQDIGPWCSKKTVTRAVLEPKRTNEQRVLDALAGEDIQEGDKVRMFFEEPKKLCLDKHFKGVYDENKLYEKLFKTVKVLDTVLDMEDFKNYKLVRNKKLLEEL